MKISMISISIPKAKAISFTNSGERARRSRIELFSDTALDRLTND